MNFQALQPRWKTRVGIVDGVENECKAKEISERVLTGKKSVY